MNLDPSQILHTYGYLAVLLAPMVESTGIPFPGETVLIAAAAYSAETGRLDLPVVIAAAAAGAIVGDNFGYGIGRLFGRAVLERWGSKVGLTETRLRLLDRFFKRRGPLAVFVARFVAVLRTFGAILAGAGEMRYPTFLFFNALGGAAWATAYGLLGYELGRAYQRLSGTIGAAAVVIGVAAIVAFVAILFLARERLERWALGDEV
jgi:membrane protein DedA with SNARE-associated domain